jgi:hypothetical protein
MASRCRRFRDAIKVGSSVMSETTIEERVSTLEKNVDVEMAVRLATEGLSKEIREAREGYLKAREEDRKAWEADRQGFLKAREEDKEAREADRQGFLKAREEDRDAWMKEMRGVKLWLIGTFLGTLGIFVGTVVLCVTLTFHESDKSWTQAMKAYDQSSTALARADQARSDVEALRTTKTVPQEGKLHSMAE